MIVTEIKTIDFEACIPENPFYIKWLNPLSEFDYWLFGTRQVLAYDIDDVDVFEPVVNYLQIANGLQQVTRKDAFEYITVGYEGLTQAKVDGIKHVLKSPLIYWIVGTPASNDYQEMIIGVKPGSYTCYDNGDGLHNMEITFIKPKLQTQSV